jgi:hypothetical protein
MLHKRKYKFYVTAYIDVSIICMNELKKVQKIVPAKPNRFVTFLVVSESVFRCRLCNKSLQRERVFSLKSCNWNKLFETGTFKANNIKR